MKLLPNIYIPHFYEGMNIQVGGVDVTPQVMNPPEVVFIMPESPLANIAVSIPSNLEGEAPFFMVFP